MRLDHISYVTSHDQISDTVQRLGAKLGTTFVDGGAHPRFGTRNFTAPLINGHYIEVVCPLDHPATDKTPFGRAVKQRADEGGGWLTWVLSVDDVAAIEKRLGRAAVDGSRTKPDGETLRWKQIGILSTLEDRQLPFFVEWIENHHPSSDGKAASKIIRLEVAGEPQTVREYLGVEYKDALGEEVEIHWMSPSEADGDTGIIAVQFETPNGTILVD